MAVERRALRWRLRRLVAAYEARYALPSAQLPAALARSTLPETPEIRRWLSAWELLQRLAPAGREP